MTQCNKVRPLLPAGAAVLLPQPVDLSRLIALATAKADCVMLADEDLVWHTQAAQRAHKTLLYCPENRCQAVLAKRCLYGIVTE